VVIKNGTQTDARPGQVIANSLLEKPGLPRTGGFVLRLATAPHGDVGDAESAQQ
jgi:hypothetical protein